MNADTPVELYGPDDGGWYTTRFHDWIGLCDELRDPDVRGYVILRGLVVEKYKNPVRKLTLEILCELIPSGKKGKPSSLTRVRGILDSLSQVGLVSTPDGEPLKTSSRAAAARRPIRIRINDMPKEGYEGWRNGEAKLTFLVSQEAGRNSDPGSSPDRAADGAGRNSDPAGRNSDPGGCNSDPEPAGDLPERGFPLVPTVGTTSVGPAPSARSALGARSASTSGSGGLAKGGSAAPATSQSRLSKQDRDQVQAVRALLPQDLNTALGDRLPTNVSAAIVTALAAGQPRERTAQQLIEHRVEPRWNGYWAERFYAGALPEQPYGPLLSMLKDMAECGNLVCDDRVDIHTGQPCSACATRAQDRRADRAVPQDHPPVPDEAPVLPAQRERVIVDHSAGLRPECDDCGRPFPPGATDTLCAVCRRSAVPAPF
uniref:hypothetical protein n=1 Tax=Streptomyces sp. CA-141956 TaxID=3240051 RepID=UPI003F498254